MTGCLYYDDAYTRSFTAEVTEARDSYYGLSVTAFYPGGGGQPPDRGKLTYDGVSIQVLEAYQDENHRIWHITDGPLGVGFQVLGQLDWERRYALMRHHTLLHIVNTVVLREYHGAITGVQIGEETSRIDFNLEGFTREEIPLLEEKVNAVITRNLSVNAGFISEQEFHQRPELVRTRNVMPPIINGMLRVVEIVGFEAQACGGTHVRNTQEVGPCRVCKFDNKGKSNKRFYVTLTEHPKE